jgi:hypothetical protein
MSWNLLAVCKDVALDLHVNDGFMLLAMLRTFLILRHVAAVGLSAPV